MYSSLTYVRQVFSKKTYKKFLYVKACNQLLQVVNTVLTNDLQIFQGVENNSNKADF